MNAPRSFLPDVYFGEPEGGLLELEHDQNEADDDTLLDKTPEDVIELLGFDPLELFTEDQTADDLALDKFEWEEHLHPRDKTGKFAKKGEAAQGLHQTLTQHGYKLHPDSPHAIYTSKSGHQIAFAPPGASGSSVKLGVYKDYKLHHGAMTQHVNSAGMTKQAMHNLLTHLKDESVAPVTPSAAPVQSSASKAAVGPPLVFGSDWKKLSGTLGTTPGGKYEAPDGKLYYVKHQDPDHSRNEVLAAALFRLAGGNTFTYHQLSNGGMATDWQKVSTDKVADFTPEQRKELRLQFAINAWLANWDVGGAGPENPGVNMGIVDGKVTPLDLGGALLYRGMGQPKGDKFGNTVGEWHSLRDPKINPTAAKLYADMTDDELKESAARLKGLNLFEVFDLVMQYGPGTAKEKGVLYGKLVDRYYDIHLMVAMLPSNSAPKKAGAPPPSNSAPAPAPAHAPAAAPPAASKATADQLRRKIATWNPPDKPNSAISEYKGTGYHEMNGLMRLFSIDSLGGSPAAVWVEKIKEWLDGASTKEDVVLYRGVPKGDYTKGIEAYGKPGFKTKEDGFSSMATDKSFSRSWANRLGNGGILYTIKVPKGSKIATVSDANKNDSEYEALAQAGSRFKINKVIGPTGGGIFEIEVTLDQSHMED